MSMTYATFVQRLWVKMDLMQSDVTLTVPLPEIIESTENRIYRDLNLLATVVRDSTTQTTVSDRNFTLPATGGSTFQTVSQINIISPAGALPSLGVRNPLIKMSLGALDFISPPGAEAIPTMWAMVTDQAVVFGPPPDALYYVEIVGTKRPAPLSSTNTSTWLTENLPDLFLQAAMVDTAMYVPAKKPEAPAYLSEYKDLLATANSEEVRRRYNLAVNTPMATQPATTRQMPTGPMGGSVT
jgi:hypothetical protein